MQYNLFISGTPNNTETIPQTSSTLDSIYFRSLFDMPKEGPYHSADFYVHAYPDERALFYTYLHRNNVVGMPRENAYIALVMKVSGGDYFTDISGVYHLLEMVYRQYILGKIITFKGNSEQFISTLSNQEPLRLQAEQALGSGLGLLRTGNMEKVFSTRKGLANKKIFTVEEDNGTILQELWQAYAVHIIPAKDGWTNESEQLQTNNSKLNTEVELLRNTITNLQKQVREKQPKPVYINDPSLHEKVDALLQSVGGFGTISDENTESPHKSNWVQRKVLFIVVLVIAIIGVCVSGYLLFFHQPDIEVETLRMQLKEANDSFDALQKDYNDVINAYNECQRSNNELSDKSQQVLSLAGAKTIKIDISGSSSSFIVGSHHKVSLSKEAGKGATWEITTDGKNYIKDLGQDSIELTAAYNGNKILITAKSKDGKVKGERNFKIKQQ